MIKHECWWIETVSIIQNKWEIESDVAELEAGDFCVYGKSNLFPATKNTQKKERNVCKKINKTLMYKFCTKINSFS